MEAILWSWAVSAVVLIMIAIGLGWRVHLPPGDRWPKPWWLGVLVDARGRFSLNRLQLVLWTIVVVSLVSGVFFGRLIEGVAEPLEFTIPGRVLGLLGISVGSAVTVGAIKATRATKVATTAAPPAADGAAAPAAVGTAPAVPRAETKLATYEATKRAPFLAQVFMLEEGEYADDVVDVTKFQGFGVTIVLIVAYVAMAINAIAEAKSAGSVTALPDLKGTFLILLGISYGGYAGGKLPEQAGYPREA
jgi:hypothetical protein